MDSKQNCLPVMSSMPGNQILRYDDIEKKLADPPEPVVVIDNLPDETHHRWKDTTWGRPVDILTLPDGSMLISDDYADAIYRVTYQNK